MTQRILQDWFNRRTGRWTSSRRYLFDLGKKDSLKPVNLTTEFTFGACTEPDDQWDYEVIWTGQTEGTMRLKLLGNELHRSIGYFTSEPTVSLVSMIDADTLLTSTSYDGQRFREEIRFLHEDKLCLRQTVGFNQETHEPTLVGQYSESRIY